VAAAGVGHFFDGKEGFDQGFRQEVGTSESVGDCLEVFGVGSAWLGKREILSGDPIRKSLKKSGKEVPPDPHQNIQARKSTELARLHNAAPALTHGRLGALGMPSFDHGLPG